MRLQLQDVLNTYKSGIKDNHVILKTVSPPTDVKDSFNEVNQAQQEREKMINIANGEYNREVPRARGEAQRVIQEAEGYAIQRINEAEGDAARFRAVFEEYLKAPEVTRRRIYLETLHEVLPQLRAKIIVDDEVRQVLPLLPLGPNVPSPVQR